MFFWGVPTDGVVSGAYKTLLYNTGSAFLLWELKNDKKLDEKSTY